MYSVRKTIFLNELKLIFFISLTSLIILFFGYYISEMFNFGTEGIVISLIIATAINFFSYFFSKSIVLKSQNAIRMTENDYPEYYNNVKLMCERNNIILPELYYIKSSSLNAFATGRNQKNAAVVVTSGLLKTLSQDEIMGVVGHELSHIVHKDILITSFISTLVGYITILASVLRNSTLYSYSNRYSNKNSNSSLPLLAIVATIITPIVATIIKMAVSRSREYMADAKGAKICGNPHYLAKALYKISHNGSEMPTANEAVAPLYISNPLKGGILSNLFSTHPSTEDRIKRLELMQE